MALLAGTVLSRLVVFVFPSSQLANFVSNVFLLIPSLIIVVASLLRDSVSRLLNLVSIYLLGVFVAIRLLPAVLGGTVGLISSDYYGKRGVVRL